MLFINKSDTTTYGNSDRISAYTAWCRDFIRDFVRRNDPKYRTDCDVFIRCFFRALWSFWKHALPMIVFMFVYYGSFILIEQTDRPHYTEMHVWIDDLIPFCEIFIIPYLFWFIFMVLSCVYFYAFDRPTYLRVAKLLCFGMTLFIGLSIVFPNIQYLRPAVMPRDNIFTQMIADLYAKDTPTNLVPSIHVYNTLCVLLGVRISTDRILQKRAVRMTMRVFGGLIILSTMFIKQHSFIDVTCAFITMFAAWEIMKKLKTLREDRAGEKRRGIAGAR